MADAKARGDCARRTRLRRQGRPVMSMNLDYRKYANRCAELAHTARPPELKRTLLELSQNWLRLAIQNEQMQSSADEFRT